jgi:hypothetical protein
MLAVKGAEQRLACLTPHLCISELPFSARTAAAVCLTQALLSETDNNEEGFGENVG